MAALKPPDDLLRRLADEKGVSDAEWQVVTFALQGKPLAEIARHLGISEVAVRKRLGEVYKKFNIEGRGPGKLATLKQRLTVQPSAPVSQQDWGSAFDNAADFYGRTEELITLEDWIVAQKCRLVLLLGMGGIGKTALALKLAYRIQHKFDRVIWRSLRSGQPLIDLLADIISFLSDGKENPETLSGNVEDLLDWLIDLMQQQRCLIVLDNFESVLKPAALTGQYQSDYADYGKLLQWVGLGRMGQALHHSCLLITSREKPREIADQAGENLPVRALQLQGLKTESYEILAARGLDGSEEEKRQLVNRYIGNPLALKLVSTTIHELFGDKIADFLKQSSFIFSGIRNLLDQQFNRLTPFEKTVMYWLAINREEQVSLQELQQDILPPETQPFPQIELLETLESLNQRSLIQKNGGRFSLHSVVMEYVTQKLIEEVGRELVDESLTLLDGKPDSLSHPLPANLFDPLPAPLFRSHALIKAQAKDYIRQRQIEEILKPLLQQLIHILGSAEAVGQTLKQLLNHIRAKPVMKMGYAGGNALNLLRELHLNLSGSDYNFSNLTIWQAYLQGMELHNLDFSRSNLSKSVFNETFSSILTVAFNTKGDQLAMGDTKGEIRVWNMADNEPLLTLHGHSEWVRAIAFSPDGQTLASGSDDHTIRLWDLERKQCRLTLKHHKDGVRAISFSPDGKRLASGSMDRTICLWDVETGTCHELGKAHSSGVRSLAFHRNGRLLASGSQDRTIKLWDPANGKCIRALSGHTRGVRSVAFSPKNDNLLASSSSDRTVRLWDIESGECLHTLKEHSDRVWTVAFSADGKLLASGGDDQTVCLWDVASGERLHTLKEHTSRVWSVAFTSLFDEAQGKIVQTLVSSSDDQTIRLWDVSEVDHISPIQTLQGYSRSIRSVAFAPEQLSGRLLLASGSDDQTVRIWDGVTGECIQSLVGHNSRVWAVAFSPDSKTLASGSDDQTVRLWDVETGRCLDVLPAHQNWVRTVAFSPDGQWLASGSDDTTIYLCRLADRACWHLEEHEDWVWAVAFSPDSTILASGSGDGTVRLWHVKDQSQLRCLTGHQNWVRSVVFSPDGRWLASSSGDLTVRLWDLQTYQNTQTLSDYSVRVRSLAFSPDGQTLACGGEDNSVTLWDIKTNKEIRRFSGHTGWVRSVAFSEDGTLLASGSKDETIRLWRVDTGECQQVLRAKRPYEGMNISGVTGLTDAQKATLKNLGAIEVS